MNRRTFLRGLFAAPLATLIPSKILENDNDTVYWTIKHNTPNSNVLAYPMGNPTHPVNSLYEAKIIANKYNIGSIQKI